MTRAHLLLMELLLVPHLFPLVFCVLSEATRCAPEEICVFAETRKTLTTSKTKMTKVVQQQQQPRPQSQHAFSTARSVALRLRLRRWRLLREASLCPFLRRAPKAVHLKLLRQWRRQRRKKAPMPQPLGREACAGQSRRS